MRPSRGRGRVGVLVPFTNTNLEPDLSLMAPDGISFHAERLGGYDEDETPDENQMQQLGEADLDECIRLLMGVKPDVVIYGCTSATLTHGAAFDHALASSIGAASGAQTVTAAGAIVGALQHLGVTQIGFASPYVPAINDLAVDFLASEGIIVKTRSEVDGPFSNEDQGAMTPGDVYTLGAAADCKDAEAVVLSCTDMRSVEAVADLEAALRKPVVTSNQAILFETLQHLNISEPVPGFGRLLKVARL